MNLILFGAGGHAKVAADVARNCKFKITSVFDNQPEKSNMPFQGCLICSEENKLLLRLEEQNALLIIAIGSNSVRRKKFLEYQKSKVSFATLIHPRAYVSDTVTIAPGTVVMAGCVIHPDTHIGYNAIINTSASIDHDCRLEAHTHIAPQATLCGGVTVGELSWVGAGAIVREGIRIGKNCIVGAGAVVVQDIPDNTMMLGVPARAVKILEKNI